MKAIFLALLVAAFAAPAAAQTITVPDPGYSLDDGIPEAPSDGKTYGRQNEDWSEVTGAFPEAPVDGNQYARQDAAWEIVDVPPTPPAAGTCEFQIDLDDGGTLQDVQDAINTWNVFSDTDGDGKNDKVRVCVKGTTNIDGSDALTSYIMNGSSTAESLTGGSQFYLKVNGVDPTITGCGIRDHSPIACATSNLQSNLMRNPVKSLPLFLDFQDVIVKADRSNWVNNGLPTVFLQIGDGYHSGGMQTTSTSTGYNTVSDVVVVSGNLMILNAGDGDGFPGTHSVPIPPRFSTTKLLEDETSFIGFFYDQAVRIMDEGLNYTFRFNPPAVSNQGNKDETTIAFFNRHTWSQGNLFFSVQDVGVNALFQSVANNQTVQGYRGEFRGGQLGFVLGDPYYGCDTVYHQDNAGNASGAYYPCGGIKIDTTYEGNQNVIFGNFGHMIVAGYSELRATEPNASAWSIAAGANSVSGELCMNQAAAEAQVTGSVCMTPYRDGGVSQAPVVSLNTTGANYGVVSFEGSMGGEIPGEPYYTVAIGNNPDSLQLKFNDNMSGPGQLDPDAVAQGGNLMVPFICQGDNDCDTMTVIYGDVLSLPGRFAMGLPVEYQGEYIRYAQVTVRDDCSTWDWTQARSPGAYGDLCLQPNGDQSEVELWACMGRDDVTGFCRAGEIIQVSGSGGGGGTDPQTAINTADIATNASAITVNTSLANAASVTAGFQNSVIGATVQKQPTQNVEFGGSVPGAGAFGFDVTSGDLSLRRAGAEIVTIPSATEADCLLLSESGDNGGSFGAKLCVENTDWSADRVFRFNADGTTTFAGADPQTAVNTADIATNTSAIAANTSAVASQGGSITTLNGTVAGNSTDIAALQSAVVPYSSVLINYTTPGIYSDSVNTPIDVTFGSTAGSGSSISFDIAADTVTFADAGLYKITFQGTFATAADCPACADSTPNGGPFSRGSLQITAWEAAGFAWSVTSAPSGMLYGRDTSTMNFGTNGYPPTGDRAHKISSDTTRLITVTAGQSFQLYLESTGLNLSQNSYEFSLAGQVLVERIE